MSAGAMLYLTVSLPVDADRLRMALADVISAVPADRPFRLHADESYDVRYDDWCLVIRAMVVA